MSLFKELMDKLSKMYNFRIDFVSKSMYLNGKEVDLTSTGDYLSESDLTGFTVKEKATVLYENYRFSSTSGIGKKKSTWFKPIDPDDLSLVDLVDGEDRKIAQYRLEVFILCSGLQGLWEFEPRQWYWQSDIYPDFVVKKNWVTGKPTSKS